IQVGPVPVVVVPKVPVFLTASGSAGLGFEVSGTVGGALSWSSADPTHLATQNLSSGPTVNGRVIPGVTVTGEVKVGLQVQPQAGIYDAAGPNIEADLDDDAKIDFNPAPGDPFLTIAKEIDLKAGLDLDLLGQHASLEASIGAFQFGSGLEVDLLSDRQERVAGRGVEVDLGVIVEIGFDVRPGRVVDPGLRLDLKTDLHLAGDRDAGDHAAVHR